MKPLATLLLLLSLASCAPKTTRPEHIEKNAYTLSYDGRHKNPRVVYEKLSAESVENHGSRKGLAFMQDPQVPDHLQAHSSDFEGSGFDRGHLPRRRHPPCRRDLLSHKSTRLHLSQ